MIAACCSRSTSGTPTSRSGSSRAAVARVAPPGGDDTAPAPRTSSKSCSRPPRARRPRPRRRHALARRERGPAATAALSRVARRWGPDWWRPRHRAHRGAGGPAGRGRRGPDRQRARGRAALRRPAIVVRPRDGDDRRLRRRRRRLRRRRDHARARLGLEALAARTAKLPRSSSRRPDRHRPRHRRRHPERRRSSATRRCSPGCWRGCARRAGRAARDRSKPRSPQARTWTPGSMSSTGGHARATCATGMARSAGAA